MSTFVLPPNLSRRGRAALGWIFTAIDDTGEVMCEGSPPSALTTLCRLLDVDRIHAIGAIADLCNAGIATTRREPTPGVTGPGTLRVRIAIGALEVTGGCEECGSPSRGTGRWCAYHRQTSGDRREWQVRAQELHHEGISPTRIAIILRRPLFISSSADGREARGGAVVPFLLGAGLLGEEWATRLRNAQGGAPEEVP